jgi:hypothetical protein
MFGWFTKTTPTVEQWANHNAKKATPDDLIAGAIVQSFAKDFKHWKFEGEFYQKWGDSRYFKPTSLSRKMIGKKHVEIVFLFRQTSVSDGYSNIYKYKTIGCEVNGVRITNAAFRLIYDGWQGIVVKVRAAEAAAAEAKAAMEANEKKWGLAEALLGMKRNGGALVPVRTVEGEA